MVLTNDQVYGRIQDVLIEALGVEPDEINPQALLTSDLGAESIDFIDISFRLEKAFGVTFRQEDLLPEDFVNNPALVEESQLTDAGVEVLMEQLPHADVSQLTSVRQITEVTNVVTVNTLVALINQKIVA